MKVYTDIEQLPVFNNAVITIGTFDGVHQGHCKILELLRSEANRVHGETVIITFNPHPRKIVTEKSEKIQLINTIEERALLFEKEGIDRLVIVPFTKAFSEQSPENYVEQFLYARFRPAVVIIGYDHRFGKNREGDYKLLETYSSKGLFELKEIPQHVISHNAVSSTRIREKLNSGDIKLANELLGYSYFFDGIVVRGDQRGRTIGFPTANLQVISEDKLIPVNGVYAVQVKIATADGKFPDKPLNGMMNIGVRPTVDGTRKTIEVHLFNFSEDIYGKTLRVYLEHFIRPEQKFSGLDALKAQLARDQEETLKLLSNTH